MSFFEKVKQSGTKERYIAIGAVGVGVGLALWYAWSHSTNPINHFRKSDPVYKSVSERFEAFKKDHLHRVFEVKQMIQGDQNLEFYNKKTLLYIQSLAFEVSEYHLNKNLKENREERRKVLNTDKQKYERIVVDGIKKQIKCFEESLREILKDSKQDKAKYEKSVNHYRLSDEHLVLEGSKLLADIKSRIESRNQVIDFTKELAIQASKTMKTEYEKLDYKPETIEFRAAVRESILYDKVYEELKLEEEDIKKMFGFYECEETAGVMQELASKLAADSV